MSILMAAFLALGANDEYDLDLATALARRGWVELAEEVVGRIDKNHAGLPLTLAEVSFAKARRESDVRRAAKELDAAVERLTRAGRVPTLDERGMTGWLHVQKAKILNQAAEEDAAIRPEALKSWEAAEAFYRASVAELEKMASSRAVDEALLDARLEIPKAIASQARVPRTDEARRAKLLRESIGHFSDFMFRISNHPVLLEAVLEEGRCRADLKDYVRAERCFRSLPGIARDVKKAGYPMGDYMRAQLHAGVLSLVQMLTPAGKPKDAVAACDEFLRDNPTLVRAPIGYAVALAKADALFELKDEAGAIDLAQKVTGQDPDGAAGRMARGKLRTWARGKNATPERLMSVIDGLVEKGQFKDALEEIRRCLELCTTPADRAKYEPVALFKRAECLRGLQQEAEAAAAWQEIFRKHPAHPLAQRAAMEAIRSLSRTDGEAAMEKLVDEIEKLNFKGEIGTLLKFLRGQILENKKQYKGAAGLYLQVEESFEAYDDAMVSAGHCLRLDGQPAAAEVPLKRVLARPLAPRLRFTAHHELAMIALKDRPKEALEHLAKCATLLPQESTNGALLVESEIQAHLALKDFTAATERLEKLLAKYPDSASTVRSCRRVAAQLEPSDPAKSARYYRAWLDRASTAPTTPIERQAAADGLYRIARAINGFDEKVISTTDLKGRPVRDPAPWADAVRAHELLILSGGLAEKDAAVAATRLVWCAGFAADWPKSKAAAEKLIQENRLLNKDGTLNDPVLREKGWLAGVYYEYGHSLYQLGKAGQKFQFGNALTAYNNLIQVTQVGSEPWWIAQYMAARIRFERGEGSDLRDAGAVFSNLERNHPGFDEGRFGMKDRLVELRDKVRAASGPQR